MGEQYVAHFGVRSALGCLSNPYKAEAPETRICNTIILVTIQLDRYVGQCTMDTSIYRRHSMFKSQFPHSLNTKLSASVGTSLNAGRPMSGSTLLFGLSRMLIVLCVHEFCASVSPGSPSTSEYHRDNLQGSRSRLYTMGPEIYVGAFEPVAQEV